MDAATVEALRARYGLDQPMIVQYWRWIRGFPKGDFGFSLEWNAPVWDVIAERMGWTLLLSGLALVFMWVVSIPIGIYSARNQYSLGDNLFSFLGFLGLSIPDFMLALIWLVFGTLVLGIPCLRSIFAGDGRCALEYGQVSGFAETFVGRRWLLGVIGTAELIRIMRGSMLEVLNQQYITTARAKGLPERTVINKYAVRMAINPLDQCLRDAGSQNDFEFDHCRAGAVHPNHRTGLLTFP